MGRAAQIAAGQIRDQLLQAGAKTLEAHVEDLELKEMRLQVGGVPEKNLTIPQLFRAIYGEPSGSLFGNHTLRTAASTRRPALAKDRLSGFTRQPAPKSKSTLKRASFAC